MKLLASLLAIITAMSMAHAELDAPKDSVYQLQIQLTDQAARTHKLDLNRGQPTLVTMFYASCPGVCPLLFENLQRMESALDAKQRSQLRVLMVSIDPERDTPQALATLAKQHHADLNRWTLARVKSTDVRKLAAVLNIQYRRLPNGEFNHSSVITLLDADGRNVAHTSQLNGVDKEFAAALTRQFSK